MVFIRNIINLHKEMLTGEMLEVHYTSHKSSLIYKDDRLETCNGDLKIVRTRTSNRCVIILDCSEVERVVLMKEETL